MPGFRIGQNGTLIDDKGNPVELNGEKIVLQDALNGIVQKAKADAARERDAAVQQQIDELNAKLTESLPKAKADELRARLSALETQLSEAGRAAAQERTQMKSAVELARQEERARAEAFRSRLREERVKNAITAAAARANVLDPDLVFSALASAVTWEPVLDAEGKDTGDETFSLRYKTKTSDGRTIEKFGAPEEAIQSFVAERPFLVRANGRSGAPSAGPANLPSNSPTLARMLASGTDIAKLTPEQKIAIGLEARNGATAGKVV